MEQKKVFKTFIKRVYDPERLADFLINACDQYQACELIAAPVCKDYIDIPYEFRITSWEMED